MGKLIQKMTIVSAAAAVMLTGSDLFAQAKKAGAGAGAASAAQAAGREGVSFKKVEMTRARTPEFNNSNNEANTTPGEWARVVARFDTEAEWTDQLELRFYIAVKHPKTGAYTMFTGTYVYSDIPKGRNHQAAVFLKPRTLDRWGIPERAAAEMYSKGELIGAGSFPEDNKQPWWRSTTVRSVEGYVAERSQTPFANIAPDNYETPKAK